MKRISSTRLSAPSFDISPTPYAGKRREKPKVKKPKKPAPPPPPPIKKMRAANRAGTRRRPPVEAQESRAAPTAPLEDIRRQIEECLTRLCGVEGAVSHLLLGVELHQRLDVNAKRRGLEIVDVLREAVQRFLETEVVDPTPPADAAPEPPTDKSLETVVDTKDAALDPPTDKPLEEAVVDDTEDVR